MTTINCRVCEKTIEKSHIKSDCICSGCYQRSLPSWDNKLSRYRKKRALAKNEKTNKSDFIAKAIIAQSIKMAGDIHSQFADGLLNHFEMIEKFHQLYLEITNARDAIPELHNLEEYMPERIR
jgi:GTP1/Obg family GTP-binding protein